MSVSVDRVLHLISGYFVTTIVVVASIALLKDKIPSDKLGSILNYVFIMSIAAGVEPGTAKARMLSNGNVQSHIISSSLIFASITKSLALSPLFVLLWLYTSDSAGFSNVVLLIPLIVALGFVASDIRTILDARSNHARAIWLKQGSVSIGISVATAAMLWGTSVTSAVALSCATRLVWTVALVASGKPSQAQDHPLRCYILSHPWPNLLLASVTGAAAASIDRAVVLRQFGSDEAAAYIFFYELLSKFWILPYLLSPIVFAKIATGETGHDFGRSSKVLVWSLGLPFIAVAPFAVSLPFAHSLVQGFEREFSPLLLVVFACSIVLAAHNMVLIAALQAKGRLKRVTVATSFGLAGSLLFFPLGASNFGMPGIFIAWLLKGLVELLFLSLDWPNRIKRAL